MPNSFECFWALKALDNTEMSSDGIPVEQMVEISARLIEDEDIRTIVCGSMMTDTPEKDVCMGVRMTREEIKQEKRGGLGRKGVVITQMTKQIGTVVKVAVELRLQSPFMTT